MNIDLIVFIVMLGLGYFFGRLAEKKHYKSIIARESEYKDLLVFNGRVMPVKKPHPELVLVGGNVVISIDYFKRMVAGLRQLFGGRVTSYESLLDRARREAILRMKEDALDKGAEAIFNLRLETASISKGRKNKVGCVEVYAYGTAVIANDT